MKLKKIVSCLLIAVLAISFFGSCESSKNDGKYKIALISLDSIDQHWLRVNDGAQKAAEELGCTVTFMPPAKKDDALSIEQLNNAISAGYDAVLFAAGSHDAPVSTLKDAASNGMKIVYVDSAANFDAEATFCTDNFNAGKVAGENMLEELKKAGIKSGKIGIVSVKKSLNVVIERTDGFAEAFKDTDFELLEIQYGEGDIALSQTIAENFITQDVVGIFGSNEGCTTGIGNAIKASGKTDLIGCGLDTSDMIRGLLNDGYLKCIITQNPEKMGYEGVKAAVDALNGKSRGGEVVDTGVNVVRAESK